MSGIYARKSITVYFVPVLNEEENVAVLHAEIITACKNLGKTFEVIFINDGSTDNTFHVSKRLLEIGVKVIWLDNFNEYYDVSLKESRNKILELMDLQLLIRLLQHHEQLLRLPIQQPILLRTQ